jgi:hypothetical protein
MAEDYSTGPPQRIALTGNGLLPARPAKQSCSWGAGEVSRVVASTACGDPRLAEAALEDAAGDVDLAIEKVIERLSQLELPVDTELADCAVAADRPAHHIALDKPATSQQQEVRVPEGEMSAVVDSASREMGQSELDDGSGTNGQPEGEQQGADAGDDDDDVQVVGTDSKLADSKLAGSSGSKRSVRVAGASKAPARNKNCPCGSKRKYKNCCGTAAAAAARRRAAAGGQGEREATLPHPAADSTQEAAAQLKAIDI